MAREVKEWVEKDENFEILAPLTLNVVCFRYKPRNIDNLQQINELNESLLHKVNETGEIYITHTKLDGKYTLRMVIAQTDTERKHVSNAWKMIEETASQI